MTGLYILTKYLTFPGALTRGMWEQIVCRFSKVPVEDNHYLRKDEMSSHIEHEFMQTARSAFAVCFVPFLFQLIGSVFLGVMPSILLLYLGFNGDILFTVASVVSYWFAASLLSNCFPLIEDVLNMTEKVYGKGNILQKIFYTPGIAILYVGAYLERYCLSFILVVAATVALIV